MPYRTNVDLPAAIREHLPTHAQDIFRNAYNNAWKHYQFEGDRREEIAHRVAWAAVKKKYRKMEGHWLAKDKV
ncbi:ChaB family protein [Parvibaculum sp.]|uniref:ChaB family protein n=1 Tax=Parvibaculum sp. TaxID=2024848 RepID=UPI0034A0749B